MESDDPWVVDAVMREAADLVIELTCDIPAEGLVASTVGTW
jgi:hypothetical protein